MERQGEPAIITALVGAVDAIFNAFEAAYRGLVQTMIGLLLWTGIIGFGLVFVAETIEFEMNPSDASLDLSMRAFMFSAMFYALRLFVRSLRARR